MLQGHKRRGGSAKQNGGRYRASFERQKIRESSLNFKIKFCSGKVETQQINLIFNFPTSFFASATRHDDLFLIRADWCDN